MKRPAFQFYPADWRNNANLGRCSPAARGIWVDILCVLHDSDEYGVVRWPLVDLANAAHAPMKLIRELVEKNVLKGGDKQVEQPYIYTPRSGRRDGTPVTLVPLQAGPVWYSSRMVKDEHVRTTAGASTRFGSNEDGEKPPRHTQDGTDRAKLRARVLEKTGGICYHCQTKLGDAWEIDHLMPRSRGGRHIFSNLMPSCVACNQDKSDTMPDDLASLRLAPSHSPSRRDGEDKGHGSSSSSSPSGINTNTSGTTYLHHSAVRLNGSHAAGLPKPECPPPDCPHQRIRDLWAELMPELQQPAKWSEARAMALRSRWREEAAENHWASEDDGLRFFAKLFRWCRKSDFLMGRTSPTNGHAAFSLSVPWLIKAENWAKVQEGNYHHES